MKNYKKECYYVWVNMCIMNVKLKKGKWMLVRKWVWVYISVSGWKKMCEDIWVRNDMYVCRNLNVLKYKCVILWRMK